MAIVKKEFKRLHDLLLMVEPSSADSIVWLQGDRHDRADKVLELYQRKFSKRIIISGNNILIGDKTRRGERNISLNEMRDWLLQKGVEQESLFIDDEAMNTKDQAEHLIKLAKMEGWSKLIIVGSSYYQPRVFLTFIKQAERLGWDGEIINQSKIIGWDDVPGGRSIKSSLIFEEEFKKINKYQEDLTSIGSAIEILHEKMFNLREVVADDVKQLFDWTNDRDVRDNSKNHQEISWEDHVSWLANKLSDQMVKMYIMTVFQKDIGVIRFEQINNLFVISYSIDQYNRGCGLGELILTKGMEMIKSLFGNPVFIAHVKKGNISSEKIFSKLGFNQSEEVTVGESVFNIYQK